MCSDAFAPESRRFSGARDEVTSGGQDGPDKRWTVTLSLWRPDRADAMVLRRQPDADAMAPK